MDRLAPAGGWERVCQLPTSPNQMSLVSHEYFSGRHNSVMAVAPAQDDLKFLKSSFVGAIVSIEWKRGSVEPEASFYIIKNTKQSNGNLNSYKIYSDEYVYY